MTAVARQSFTVRRAVTLLGALLAVTTAGRAAPLFVAEATNGVLTIREGDSAMLDLIDRTIERDGEFAAFAGTDFDASITFLGVPSAINVALNGAGTAATLEIPGINFRRDFTGSSEREVRDKVRDFLKSEGADIVARLRTYARARSAASVTDGNPDSNTASAARAVFFNHGLSAPATLSFDGETPAARFRRQAVAVTSRTADLTIAGRSYHANQYRFGANLLGVDLGDRVRLELPVHADYVDIEGTEIFGGGAYIAMPVQFLRMDAERAVGYRLTPVGGAQSRASFDAVSGAIVCYGGLVSSLDVRVAPSLIVSIINQATYHQGLPLQLQDFEFESDIEQVIVKNGVRLLTRLGRPLYLSGYYVNTRFLNDAAIDSYHTLGAGLEGRLGERQSLALVLESDIADGYNSGALRLEWNRSW